MSETETKQAGAGGEVPALWGEAAPRHFDNRIPWWVKVAGWAGAVIVAILWVDQPVAAWVLQRRPLPDHGDIFRELTLLEQYGQWTCSVLVIVAVGMMDRAGRRKALAIGMGCLATVLVSYLVKDLFGRSRPGMVERDAFPELTKALTYPFTGEWRWGGPSVGFVGGSRWTSFPSAHTTGAFALSCGLAWFYPRGRALFMTLATITAVQRFLHGAHYVSDTVAGMGLAVMTVRWTLRAKLAGRLMAVMPAGVRAWWMGPNKE